MEGKEKEGKKGIKGEIREGMEVKGGRVREKRSDEGREE
jgi:hypothetical protein